MKPQRQPASPSHLSVMWVHADIRAPCVSGKRLHKTLICWHFRFRHSSLLKTHIDFFLKVLLLLLLLFTARHSFLSGISFNWAAIITLPSWTQACRFRFPPLSTALHSWQNFGGRQLWGRPRAGAQSHKGESLKLYLILSALRMNLRETVSYRNCNLNSGTAIKSGTLSACASPHVHMHTRIHTHRCACTYTHNYFLEKWCSGKLFNILEYNKYNMTIILLEKSLVLFSNNYLLLLLCVYITWP